MSLSLRHQRTLAGPITIKGRGYWSGLNVQVLLKPANVNTGIVFHRPDLPDCPALTARVSNRVSCNLRTVLANGHVRIEMIEHLMAALAGMAVDNCEVWIDRDELPGLDGSAKAYVDEIRRVGVVSQQALREKLIVTHTIRMGDQHRWVEARPCLNRCQLEYHLEFQDCQFIGKQSINIEMTPESFEQQIASARTFIRESDALKLRDSGLCQHVAYADLLVFGANGLIDNELRFQDECVRHKVLDFYGDLALAPFDLVGHFVGFRSGHELHTQLIHRLLQEGRFVEAARAA
ncbi:MAG TPA: UDP-3-O-acyl-N-acetylglucosamine deacetylase [Pirellulaceae bacterium]|nr:UDP-3-O-acyl-N-acetylglucosamine deacetylase [Pirellulaceae bacterium]HMO91543.1 UDP-3-O-acyl-N-acetylglucosamine deacetylase [Pirellulaceae bacterium]HMP68240.1 UDP-3-O-acyl-N-acetylglucosamine deacetylase [Pirellulaceae bacterium]